MKTNKVVILGHTDIPLNVCSVMVVGKTETKRQILESSGYIDEVHKNDPSYRKGFTITEVELNPEEVETLQAAFQLGGYNSAS